jgi:hypothetical protein
MKIPRKVTTFGKSYVLVLDKQTRDLLKLNLGDIVYIEKESVE